MKDIIKYNQLLGHESGSGLSNPDKIKTQWKAIKEELHEFSISRNNSIEELDGICDVIVTCMGMCHLLGVRKFVRLDNPDKKGLKAIKLFHHYLDSTDPSNIVHGCTIAVNGLLATQCYNEWYDILPALNHINQTNLDKRCTTLEQKQATIDKYKEFDVEVYFNHGMPICRYAEPGSKYFPGKGLKRVGWIEPDLTPYMKSVIV